MNKELEVYRQKVKIGWLVTALIFSVIVFTLGVIVSPFVSMNEDLHVLAIAFGLFLGGGFSAACMASIFSRIKKIENCLKA